MAGTTTVATTPTEYEHYIAELLAREGWDVHVTPPRRDFGLDIVCERPGRRLGIQVKMYGAAGRPINAQMVMHLYGAAAYRDCSEAMLVTDGRVLEDARKVAAKLGVEIRYEPAPTSGPDGGEVAAKSRRDGPWTFDRVWQEQVMPLAGRVLERGDGSTNEIISVDWSGLTRRTSNGSVQTIDIEIFRWTIERLLEGETVLREEINAQYPKRASSGIVLVLESLPMFEGVRRGRKKGLRLRGRR